MILPKLEDVELCKELNNAYAITAPYRARLQYRLAVITATDTIIFDDIIFNSNFDGVLVNADTRFISESLLI